MNKISNWLCYACFYQALPQYLTNNLERLEEKTVSIITLGISAESQELDISPILDLYNHLYFKRFYAIIAE